MKVYKFLYCSCIHESSFATISIHRTKLGAYKAMRKSREETYILWYDERLMYGKRYYQYPYDYNQVWTLQEAELLD